MLLVVARVGRAHGLKGEATVELRTDDPDSRLAVGAKLFTDPDQGLVTIARARFHSGTMLLTFEGFEDRTQVERLRNTLLLAEVDIDAPGEDEDDFHDYQLIDARVELEDGTHVGVIREVLHLPAQDLLAIDREGMDELLIPFVRELVPVVDTKARRVVITPPVGMMEA